MTVQHGWVGGLAVSGACRDHVCFAAGSSIATAGGGQQAGSCVPCARPRRASSSLSLPQSSPSAAGPRGSRHGSHRSMDMMDRAAGPASWVGWGTDGDGGAGQTHTTCAGHGNLSGPRTMHGPGAPIEDGRKDDEHFAWLTLPLACSMLCPARLGGVLGLCPSRR